MRQSYFKNAALLTGSDVVLRLAGMGLRIWLANALGGAGMGLYQLVLAVYGLFVTLATAGISVAAARLLTEELSRDKAAARGMLVRLVLAGLTLGGLAMAAQLATAGLAAKWWLGDVRAAAALRTSALGLPSAGCRRCCRPAGENPPRSKTALPAARPRTLQRTRAVLPQRRRCCRRAHPCPCRRSVPRQRSRQPAPAESCGGKF